MKSKIIITAGGTSERIDNVRKITNSSSGKLGCVIASKLLELKREEIDRIYYIAPKNALRIEDELIEYVEIVNTNDLKENVERLLRGEKIDYFIHSMAVSDYTVDFVTTARAIAESIEANKGEDIYEVIVQGEKAIKDSKISSYEDDLMIKLKRTPKIISLIKDISPNTYLVGFKLLDNVTKERLIEVATELKVKNRCDLVVANDLANIRKGNHLAYIIGDEVKEASGKEDIALKLVRKMFNDKV